MDSERQEPGDGADAERSSAERGAESYGGDPDAEPSVTEEELGERDQAEG
jgi:hypothetical protein